MDVKAIQKEMADLLLSEVILTDGTEGKIIGFTIRYNGTTNPKTVEIMAQVSLLSSGTIVTPTVRLDSLKLK
jgi:non-ribosomal peptide synthetase component F